MRLKTGWTDEEVFRLKKMAGDGASVARIAVAFKRPMSSIKIVARRHGIPLQGIRAAKKERDAKIDAARKAAGPIPERFW